MIKLIKDNNVTIVDDVTLLYSQENIVNNQAWSTDFNLPEDANVFRGVNLSIFGGLNKTINCQCLIDNRLNNCRLEINKIEDGIVNLTIFVNIFPESYYKKFTEIGEEFNTDVVYSVYESTNKGVNISGSYSGKLIKSVYNNGLSLIPNFVYVTGTSSFHIPSINFKDFCIIFNNIYGDFINIDSLDVIPDSLYLRPAGFYVSSNVIDLNFFRNFSSTSGHISNVINGEILNFNYSSTTQKLADGFYLLGEISPKESFYSQKLNAKFNLDIRISPGDLMQMPDPSYTFKIMMRYKDDYTDYFETIFEDTVTSQPYTIETHLDNITLGENEEFLYYIKPINELLTSDRFDVNLSSEFFIDKGFEISEIKSNKNTLVNYFSGFGDATFANILSDVSIATNTILTVKGSMLCFEKNNAFLITDKFVYDSIEFDKSAKNNYILYSNNKDLLTVDYITRNAYNIPFYTLKNWKKHLYITNGENEEDNWYEYTARTFDTLERKKYKGDGTPQHPGIYVLTGNDKSTTVNTSSLVTTTKSKSNYYLDEGEWYDYEGEHFLVVRNWGIYDKEIDYTIPDYKIITLKVLNFDPSYRKVIYRSMEFEVIEVDYSENIYELKLLKL